MDSEKRLDVIQCATVLWVPFGKRLKWMESLACPERLPGGFAIKTEHHTNLYSAGCSNPVAIGQLWMITDTQSFTERA